MEILEQAPMMLASGFGINTDILETNIVNQIILGGGLFVLGRDFLSESLGQRQAEIMSGVQDSEKRLNEATSRLEEAKKQLSQAQVIIEEIKKETSATKSKSRGHGYGMDVLPCLNQDNVAIIHYLLDPLLNKVYYHISITVW